MARPEVTGKKLSGTGPQDPLPVPPLAMSIPQFCTAHNISEGMFYKLKKQKKNLTPREMKIGTRTLITFEAARDWRAEREAAGGTPKVRTAALPAPPAKARAKVKPARATVALSRRPPSENEAARQRALPSG